MNKYHLEILEEIKKRAVKEGKVINKNKKVWGDKYFGTKRLNYKLSQPQARAIAKKWVATHQTIPLNNFLDLSNSLYKGQSHDERTFGGKLLEYLPQLRKQINPDFINSWLTGAQGWWEVDSLCQMSFGGQEMLEKWEVWRKLIKKLVSDQDVHKRRASLVLLTKPVRESNDPRLASLAFENIDQLKAEKDFLITKAISWLLRDLIKYHRQEVEDYLSKNQSTLPKIALRETRAKLLTGKK